jgi:hypothetical protein
MWFTSETRRAESGRIGGMRRQTLWLALLVALQLAHPLESAGGDAEGGSGEFAWLHRPRPL